MKKSELLDWLKEKYQQWEALLDEIGPTRMDEPGVTDDWSMKDMVAHLTGWNRRLVAHLQAAQRGEPEPPPSHLHCTERSAVQVWPAHLQNEDDINAWIYESHRGRSAREVLDESEQVFRQLLTTIESLPDDIQIERIEPEYYLVWVDNQRFPAGEFFDHFHDDHEPDVRAWLARGESA